MHKVFGIKEDVPYSHRPGAYLIPLRDGNVGVVQTPKGYFFLGGGLEPGEDPVTCIRRECLEETGCAALVGPRLCSAESYSHHPVLGYFHPSQTYYLGALSEPVCAPKEPDHRLCWVALEELRGKMFVQMQNWALEQLIQRT